MMTEENTGSQELVHQQWKAGVISTDPREALEDLLVNAHRIAVSLAELRIFKNSELTVAEWSILKLLGGQANVPVRKLSLAAGISRQRFRKLIAELERKGLVTSFQARDDDKRARLISATPTAAQVLGLVSTQIEPLLASKIPEQRGARSFVGAARTMENVVKAIRRNAIRSAEVKPDQNNRG